MRKRFFSVLIVMVMLTMMIGCAFKADHSEKIKDLEFTVLSEEVIPEELKSIIDSKCEEPFMLTYTDDDNLYICVGYGKQKSTGYSIVVEELYLTEKAVYVSTELLGPDKENDLVKNSCPYIVIKTEKTDLPVIFE